MLSFVCGWLMEYNLKVNVKKTDFFTFNNKNIGYNPVKGNNKQKQ